MAQCLWSREGSLSDGDDRKVHVPLQSVGETGAYAWWVSGENQKARLTEPVDTDALSVAELADLSRSHQVPDPEPFQLERILTESRLVAKTPTLGTADLIAGGGLGPLPKESFHDLTTSSVGLLTNVATGGWRKDLSLLTDSWDDQPVWGLPSFQIRPGQSLWFNRPVSPDNYKPVHSLFYHWSTNRHKNAFQSFHMRAPVASFANLANYATLYKKLTSTTDSAPAINHQSWPYSGGQNILDGLHRPWVMPQFARVQYIVSHYATSINAAPGKLRPAVLYTPVITLWNPFNTKLTLNGKLHLRTGPARPLALKYQLPGVTQSEYWAVEAPRSGGSYPLKRLQPEWNYGFQIRFDVSRMVLNPGETRIFSPKAGVPTEVTYYVKNYYNLDLLPGLRTGTGVYIALDRILQPGISAQWQADPEQVSLPPGTNLNVDAKSDVPGENKGGGDACGLFFQWNIDSFGDPQHGNVTAHYRPDQADILYPPIENLASVSLAEAENNPVPFLSMIYGSRIANLRATATKGMVQANPLVTFTATGLNTYYADTYPGGLNPLNMPWDFLNVPHTSGPGDDMLPNVDDESNSGYIIIGVRKAEGIARSVFSELPQRPLASLGDLTHWQLRGLNPTAPHGFNLVANSDATPLIPKGEVVDRLNNPYADTLTNEQQDDSYCADHLLFDDWFFSSIAPDPDGFGPGGRNQREHFIDFLTGADELTNRAYRPIPEDDGVDEQAASEIFSGHVEPVDSWKRIASRLEVDGMFNVNSTSEPAWRALLGHARNQKIPYLNDQGGINLSGETDYAFPRSSVAGDREAGQPTPGGYFATTEFGGYRVFTDTMLDFLAARIVEQVQERGPFLSLSEFVNRQLSDDPNRALAGAIQTALNQLTADQSLNPFEVIQNESAVSVGDPAGEDGYVFRDAAEGHNTYGLPGWIRQADILRPLAPILSARDDTFTIRAYGEARSADGTVLARAWCEAQVRRKREFLDPGDEPDIVGPPQLPVNRAHGRRFQIVSFRWLRPDEV